MSGSSGNTFIVVRSLLIAILSVSFSFKAIHVYQSFDYLHSWNLIVSLVALALESILMVALAGGENLRSTFQFSRLIFLCFAGYSFTMGVVGSPSCGCFGDYLVSPWYVFSLDLALVALFTYLIKVLPGETPGGASRTGFMHKTCCAMRPRLLYLVPVVLGMVAGSANLADGVTRSQQGDQEILNIHPEVWVGKPFPLLEYVAGECDLSAGSWVVVIYYPSCHKCRKRILQYRDGAVADLPSDLSGVVFLSAGQTGQAPIERQGGFHYSSLAEGLRIVMDAPPVEVVVEDGYVTRLLH